MTTQVTSQWRRYADELTSQAERLVPVAQCLQECGSQPWHSQALDAWSQVVRGHSQAVVDAQQRFITAAAALVDHADAVDAVLVRISDARAAVIAEITQLEQAVGQGVSTPRLTQLHLATTSWGAEDVRWLHLAANTP